MLDSLEARLDDVRTLCELRGIDPSSAEHRPTLQRIDNRLTELEEAMSAARTAVAAEAEAASAARTLLADAQKLATEIAKHAPLVPAYLEDAAPPPADSRRSARVCVLGSIQHTCTHTHTSAHAYTAATRQPGDCMACVAAGESCLMRLVSQRFG